MPHGTPDFWGTSPKSTTYGLEDMAELAVRLGSYVNYDRRGEVIWAEGFDTGGQGYNITGTGVGNEVYLSCYQAYKNGLCLVLKTGAANGSLSEVNIVTRYPVLGKIGLEASFAPDVHTAKVTLTIQLFDGGHAIYYNTVYNHADGTIKVWDTTLGLVLIGTCGILRDTYQAYSQFKLVVNCLTGRYVRVLINEHTYDASAYTPPSFVDATVKSLNVFVDAYCGAAGFSEVRLDNMIATQNES